MNTDSIDRERLETRIKEHPVPIDFLPHWVECCITEGKWVIRPETKILHLRMALAFCDGRAKNANAPTRNEHAPTE